MKKIIIGFILGAITTASVTALAINPDIFTAQKATFDVYVEGQKFESENPAIVVDGRSYLPLRAIGEALGVEVDWNEEQRRVEIGKKEVVSVSTSKKETFDFAEVKSNTFNIDTPLNTQKYLIKQENVTYIYGAVFADYLSSEEGKYYINLPGREPVLVTNANERLTPIENVINYNGYSYVDIEALGVTVEIDGDTLWVEQE